MEHPKNYLKNTLFQLLIKKYFFSWGKFKSTKGFMVFLECSNSGSKNFLSELEVMDYGKNKNPYIYSLLLKGTPPNIKLNLENLPKCLFCTSMLFQAASLASSKLIFLGLCFSSSSFAVVEMFRSLPTFGFRGSSPVFNFSRIFSE